MDVFIKLLNETRVLFVGLRFLGLLLADIEADNDYVPLRSVHENILWLRRI
jgi:hypothetical protein